MTLLPTPANTANRPGRLTANLKDTLEAEARSTVSALLAKFALSFSGLKAEASKDSRKFIRVSVTAYDVSGDRMTHLALYNDAKAQGIAVSFFVTSKRDPAIVSTTIGYPAWDGVKLPTPEEF